MYGAGTLDKVLDSRYSVASDIQGSLKNSFLDIFMTSMFFGRGIELLISLSSFILRIN